MWMICLYYITVPCLRGETVSDEPYEPCDDDDDEPVQTHLCTVTPTADNQVMTLSVH